jgi:hypothetical protein
MKVSLNAFIAEVRRHFGKYTPHQQNRIMFKFSLALSFFSLALITTGLFVDQFHSEDPLKLTLKDGRTYFGPGIIIGHSGMKLSFPECQVPEIAARQSSKMFNYKGITFEEMASGPTGTDEVFDAFVSPGQETVSESFFGNFGTFYKMSMAARALSWTALGLQILSLIVMLWSQTPPATFLTKTPIFDQNHTQRSWGVVHHILTLLAAVCLLADICVVSMYLDLLVGRVIELSFELCNFNPGMDELGTLKLFGTFLQSYSDVNGVTGAVYKLAMTLTMIQATFVFYLGIGHVRAGTGFNTYSLPFAKLREIPWYASIWRLRFSVLFVVVGTLVNQAAALYSREAGYPLNVYYFRSVASAETGTGSVTTGSLSDTLMDVLSKFYISEKIPNQSLFASVPLVLALAIGSTDPQRFLSKVVQLCGIVMFLKAFISISTLSPVPATAISRPYCFDPPPASLWSFKNFFSRAAQCNHLMFSLDAAGCTLGVMVMIMYIRYGEAVKKLVAYSVLSVVLIVCLLLPVAARINYTSNVVIAFFVVALLVMTQSQAFKLLFKFDAPQTDFTKEIRKLQFTPGEVLNDKIIPNLQECVRRVHMYRMATKEASGLRLTTADIMELRGIYKSVGQAIRVARAAKPMEPTSPVGFRRPLGKSMDEGRPTPPDENGDVSAMIQGMLHGQTTCPVAELSVTDSDGAVVQATPIPLGISPQTDALQSESAGDKGSQ